MSGTLKGVQEENVLTMLVWNQEYATTLAAVVAPDLFDNRTFQQIARASINYIEQYRHPPGNHLRDLMERELRRGDDSAKFINMTIEAMERTKTDISPAFVMDGLDKFIRIQRRLQAIDVAHQALMRGDEAAADEAIRTGVPPGQHPVGVWLQDDDLSFLQVKEEDYFSIGIEELDRRGIRPVRGTAILFIAPKKRGKSWFATAVGKAGLQYRHKVLHITLENSEVLTKRRYLQSFFSMTKHQSQAVTVAKFTRDEFGGCASIDYDTVKPMALVAENSREIIQRIHSLRNRPKLLIKGFPTGSLTTTQLDAYLDMLDREHDFRPDLLIIDYPDLMNISSDNLRIDTGRTFQRLRGICNARNMAGFFPSQGNRASEDAKWVTSRMVAEDWSKTGTADIVLTYSQTSEERKRGLARILVDAARDEEDQFTVLVSQSYAIGQFCIDSVYMSKYVASQVARLTHEPEDDETPDEVNEAKHGETTDQPIRTKL